MQRRSERDIILSTKQSKLDDQVACLLKGHPTHPATYWNRSSLIDALVTLAPTRRTCEFIDKVISLGNSPYKHRSAVYKMFKLWKSTNEVPCPPGRPQKIAVVEAQDTVSSVFQARASSSSAFKLSDTKEAFTNKLKDTAAAEDFDPDSVTTGASDYSSKAMTVAAAMEEEVTTFSKTTLLKKTGQRFRSEYSMMMGYSYIRRHGSRHTLYRGSRSNQVEGVQTRRAWQTRQAKN